jgi:cytochrome c5
MASSSLMGAVRQGLKSFYRAIQLQDFSGGLNLRDAETQLADNESPEMWNVTLDERGGVVKRLGQTKWNASAAGALITQGYYSQLVDRLLWYSKSDGKLYSDPGTGVLTLRRTWTTGSRLGIVDFADKVYANHPVDGLYSSADGATWTAVVATSGLLGQVSSNTGSPGLVIPVSADTNWTRLTVGTLVDIYVRATGANLGNGKKRKVTAVSQAAGTATVDAAAAATDADAGNVTFDSTCGVYTQGAFAAPPKGDLLANWQNKLWSAGDTAHASRLSFSAAGDPQKWHSSDGGGSNDIREKDDSPILALHGSAGFDNQTKPSLLVGKKESIYRVDDPSTASYVTLDQSVGPAGAKCFVGRYGYVYLLSLRGVFRTDGFTPCVPVSTKLDPLFTDTVLNFSLADGFCAGYKGDRLRFSVARTGSSANDLALEFHPLEQWFSAGSNAAGSYVTYGKNAETLITSSPTATGQLYKQDSGGSDDGAAITCWFLTRIFEPNGGYQSRLLDIRSLIRGSFKLTVLVDTETVGSPRTLSLPSSGFVWGTGVWGVGKWGEPKAEGYATWQPGSVARVYQFRVDESSTATQSAPKLLGAGATQTVGAFSLYSLELRFVPLGLS